MSDKQVKFQIKEGQKIRGVKEKSLYTSEAQAELWESIGIGFIVVEPSPFDNTILSENKPTVEQEKEEVKEVKKPSSLSLVTDLISDEKPKKNNKKAGKK